MLGGDIGALERARFLRVDRAHIEDRARLLRIHVRDHRLGGEKRAVEVDGEHRLPVGKGEVLDRVDDLDAGIRDEDVDRAPRRDHGGDAGVDLLLVGHVHRDSHRRAGVIGIDTGSGSFGGFELQVRNGDLGSGLGIELGDGEADAAGGAGDNGDLVAEVHGKAPVEGQARSRVTMPQSWIWRSFQRGLASERSTSARPEAQWPSTVPRENS